MKWNGLNVNGYHTNGKGNSDLGMQTCSLTDIGDLKAAKRPEGCKTWAEFLVLLGQTFCYSVNEGNFLFCISSAQLEGKNVSADGFTAYLLAHENTQIIHHYTNNAHGPNCLFICIHHMFPNQVKRVVKNNLAEYRARHKFNSITHHYEVAAQ